MIRPAPGAALALVLLLVAPGCGGVEPREDMKPPPSGCVATPWSLAAVRVAYQPTDPEHPLVYRYKPAIDVGLVGSRTCELLTARGTVKDVRPLAEPPPGPPGSGERRRLEARVAAATAAGSSHLLDVSVESAEIRYDGQRLLPLKVVILVSLFPFDFPNYFIASDRYTVVARARWRLVDTRTGRSVGEGVAEGTQEGIFGDMSRGWYFLGFVRVPGCLDLESWQAIETALLPGAREALAESIVTAAENAALQR